MFVRDRTVFKCETTRKLGSLFEKLCLITVLKSSKDKRMKYDIFELLLEVFFYCAFVFKLV